MVMYRIASNSTQIATISDLLDIITFMRSNRIKSKVLLIMSNVFVRRHASVNVNRNERSEVRI